MTCSVTIRSSTGLFQLPLTFPLAHGGELFGGQLAFEFAGRRGAPVIVVQGGISSGRHVASSADAPGWWQDVVAEGGAVDLRRYRVLGVDFLGGGGASTGPDNSSEQQFPAVSTEDQARAIAALLDHLGIPRIAAFLGASYGGMVGLAFAAEFPERTERLIAISAPHRAHGLATAWRSLQRKIVRLGLEHGCAPSAVAVARGLAMTTYRSRAEFGARFAGPPQREPRGFYRFPVEDYLDARGADFAVRFGAKAFLCLSQALDLHRVDPARIAVPTTLLGVRSDQVVPISQLRALHGTLAGPARLVEIDSLYGHDAFLKEIVAVRDVLRTALPGGGGIVTQPSATRTVRSGIESDPLFGAVVPPLHLSTNYTFAGLDQKRCSPSGRVYDYTRTANPTRDLLGDALATLEGGAGAVVTSSGMSAITLVLQLLRPGDLLVAPHDCYGGSYRLFSRLAAKGLFEVRFADLTDADAVATAIAELPAMVWIETPSNPLLRITDVRSVASRARAAGALVVVDNTFLSPVLQQPVALGADIVVHSTTKYLNGHSDVVGGAAVAATPQLHDELAFWANCLGLTGSPFDSFLTLRGLRTLHARMPLHERNAQQIVALLDASPLVRRVYCPGLAAHPGRALAETQQKGFGGMLSFELVEPPSVSSARVVGAFLDGLALFSLAESLGGVESLIAHPATMTHAAMDPDARQAAGIADTLLRVSAGIEEATDLCADLAGGLARVAACGAARERA